MIWVLSEKKNCKLRIKRKLCSTANLIQRYKSASRDHRNSLQSMEMMAQKRKTRKKRNPARPFGFWLQMGHVAHNVHRNPFQLKSTPCRAQGAKTSGGLCTRITTCVNRNVLIIRKTQQSWVPTWPRWLPFTGWHGPNPQTGTVIERPNGIRASEIWIYDGGETLQRRTSLFCIEQTQGMLERFKKFTRGTFFFVIQYQHSLEDDIFNLNGKFPTVEAN